MVKNKKQNNIIWNFVEKYPNFIYFAIIIILAFFVRILMCEYNSADYDIFLKPWFQELKVYGGLSALSRSIGNYTPIYMTLLALLTYLPLRSLISIKILTCIFDFIGALAVYKITKELLSKNKYKDKIALMLYGLYLFVPTILLNGAFWAQCDSIYTAFVLLSIWYLIKNDYRKAIIFWSIAFSFKFQAIFIFPLYILMYIGERKIKFKYFLYIPLVIFILSIPKVIYTHDLLVGFRVYFEQAGTYKDYITLNFPNIYGLFFQGTTNNLVLTPFAELGTIGIGAMFVILVTLAFIVYTKKTKFDKEAIIYFALYSILITTFFLPQMHERYLFMGDAIAVLYLVINIKKFYIPLMIELVSLYGYVVFLFGSPPISFSTASIVFAIVIIIYTKDLYTRYLKL